MMIFHDEILLFIVSTVHYIKSIDLNIKRMHLSRLPCKFETNIRRHAYRINIAILFYPDGIDIVKL